MSVRENKTILTAENRTGSAFDQLRADLERTARDFQKMVSYLQLGGAAIAGGLAAVVFKAAETADQMGKLAQKTGIAVEQMSALAYAAKLSDVDTTSLAKGIKNFSEVMVKATETTSQQAAILKQLGVNAKGEVADGLLKVADTFAKLPDGATKAALATELFGKAGVDLIPLLNDGAAGIKKMTDEAQRLGLVISSETAAEAQKFNDNLTALKKSAEAFGISLLNDIGPGLAQVSQAMKLALIEGGKLNALLVGFGGLLSLAFTDDALAPLQRYQKELAGLGEEFKRLQAARDEKTLLFDWVNSDLDTRINQVTARMAELRVTITGLTQADAERAKTSAASAAADAKAKKETEDRIRNVLALAEANKKAAEKAAAEFEALMNRISGKSVGLDPNYFADLQKLFAAYNSGVLKIEPYRKAVAELTMQQKFYTDATKQAAEAQKFLSEQNELDVKAAEARGDAIKSVVEKLEDQVEAQRIEVSLLGLTNEQRALALIAIEREAALRGVLSDQQRKAIEDLYAEKEALEKRRIEFEKTQELKKQFDELTDKGAKFFADLVANGTSGFKNLRDQFKSFAVDVVKFFAQRYALQTGVQSGGGVGSVGTSGGGGYDGIVASASGPAAGYIIGGLFSGGNQKAKSGAASGAASGASIGATIGSIVPVLGTALGAIIGAVIGGIIGLVNGKKGGAKEGGGFIGEYNAKGEFVKQNTQWDLFGVHTADKEVKDLGGGIAKGFFDTLKKLGGTVDTAAFGIGYDSDPKGTAENRIKALAWINGQEIFRELDRGIGRDNAKIPEELALSANRAVLSALQAAFKNDNGPIANLLRTVNAAQATKAEIEAVIKKAEDFAEAYKALKSMISDLGAQIKGLSSDPLPALIQTLADLNSAVDSASIGFEAAFKAADPTEQLTATQQLIQAVVNRYNTEMQMIDQLTSAIDAARQGAYEFGQAMAARYAGIGRPVDTSGASLNRVAELRQNIDQAKDPAKKLAYVNQALGALDNWVQSSRDAVQRAFDEMKRADDAFVAAETEKHNKRRAVLESEIAGLQEQIKLGERLMSVSQQAAQAINDLQLSGANPLSVQGRLGLAGGNVQQLLTAFRFADPAGRADAASSLMAALQQRLQLAGEAFQRPSDEYQQIYNEVISSYTEIQAATKTDAEKLLDVQQQIAEKQAEIGEIDKAMQKLGERQLELTAQMQAQLDAINANAYAQYQIYEAIGLEAYRQAERVAQEQLNAITGGIDVQLYIAKIQTLTQQTLEAILATLQGGAYVPLPGSTTGPVTGPAGGPVGGSTIPVNPSGPVLPNSPTNPSGPLLPSGSGGPGPQPRDTGDPGGPIETPPIVIITRQPIVLNDRVMGEQIMETIVQNGRLIKQVVEVS